MVMRPKFSLTTLISVTLYTALMLFLNISPRPHQFGRDDPAVREDRCKAYETGFPFTLYYWSDPPSDPVRNIYGANIEGCIVDISIYLFGLLLIYYIANSLTYRTKIEK
jgi:hypothetical protein